VYENAYQKKTDFKKLCFTDKQARDTMNARQMLGKPTSTQNPAPMAE
jgi:hypothetical protein